MGGAGCAVGQALAAAWASPCPFCTSGCRMRSSTMAIPCSSLPTAASMPRASRKSIQALVRRAVRKPAEARAGLPGRPPVRHPFDGGPSAADDVPDAAMAGSDERNIAIDQVGIRGLRYPLTFADADGVAQPTIAVANVYVALPEDRKGTHMSRLVALLEVSAPGEPPLSVHSLRDLLDTLVVLLEAPGGTNPACVPRSIRKSAPVSGVASRLDYEVKLAGELDGGAYRQQQTVAVPVTSLCPCSKEISEYGAHNQRSTVTVTVVPAAPLWLTEMIRSPRRRRRASCTGS